MKKLFAIFAVFMLMYKSTLATVWIVDNNNPHPFGHIDIGTAIVNASGGDTIYIVGSQIPFVGTIILDKPLIFIGPGYRPDKDYPYTQTTGYFTLSAGSDGSKFFGFNPRAIQASFPVNDLEIANCYFNSNWCSMVGANGNNWYIHDNVFSMGCTSGSILSINGNNNIIENNVMSSDINTIDAMIICNLHSPAYTHNLINHNIFISPVDVFAFGSSSNGILDSSIISNNIFYGCKPHNNIDDAYITNCRFIKNLTSGSSNDLIPLGSNLDSANWISQAPVFDSVPTMNFDFNYRYQLEPTSPGYQAATDTGDIGPYGGYGALPDLSGATSLPRIKKLDLATAIIGVNDSINIHLIAVAVGNLTIDSVKYFFDADSSNGYGTVVPIVSSDSININFSLHNSLSIANHILGIRVKDSNGIWSIPEMREFNVCLIGQVQAEYNFQVSGGQDVLFTNASINEETTHWDFGDGDTVNILNPFHHYLTGGVFTACLTSYNQCSSPSTLCRTIGIDGIQTIFPNRIANNGTFVFDITGSGFDSIADLTLEQSGQTPIQADSIIRIDNNNIKAIFNFSAAPLGKWDVKAWFSNLSTSTLDSALEIENNQPPQIRVDIIGDAVLRIGFNQVYHIIINNDGNEDAYFPYVDISGLPPGTIFQFLFDTIYGGNSLSCFDSLNINFDSLQELSHVDSSTNTSFYLIQPYKIPANGQITIDVIFHIPLTTVLHSLYTLRVTVGKPIYTSIDSSATQRDGINGRDCMWALINAALVIASGGSVDPPCLIAAGHVVTSCYTLMKHLSDTESNTYIDWIPYWDLTEVMAAIWETYVHCSGVIAGELSPAFHVVAAFEAGVEVGLDCIPSGVPEYWGDYFFHLTVGNSTDPNEKYGPGGNSENHYLSNVHELNYTINFENDSSATLPAQTITVIDSLDIDKFDLSTFSFIGENLGYKSVSQNNTQSFFADIDFSNEYGVNARISGRLDTIRGIVTWVINTIDTATNQITTNAAQGILPPDTASPNGQGSVSFKIKLLPNVTNSDSVRNSASIIFDNNAPITTPVWQNIIDTIKPQSNLVVSNSITTEDSVLVSWSGTDMFSGVESYTIYISYDSVNYFQWLPNTNVSSAYFYKDSAITKVYFYSIAKDSAGNIEDVPALFDASVTFITIGVEEIGRPQFSVKMFPNPTTNAVSIIVKRFNSSRNDFNIITRDVMGRILRNEKLEFSTDVQETQMDLTGFISGVYFFEIADGENCIFKKLIKN